MHGSASNRRVIQIRDQQGENTPYSNKYLVSRDQSARIKVSDAELPRGGSSTNIMAKRNRLKIPWNNLIKER